MSARLSVVTIGRNDRAGLISTIESVRTQSVVPFEHVIIDGASTDGTREWLAEELHPPYTSVVSEPDGGIYDAMNKGVIRSTGEYILFLNSGDRFADPQTLLWLTTQLTLRRPAWGYGKSLIEVNGRLHTHDLNPFGRARFFGGFGSVPHQAAVISRATLDRIGPFRTDLGVSADQELLMRAWLAFEPSYLDRAIAICDAEGVGSTQQVGAFAGQMATYRAMHRVPRFGKAPLNSIVAVAALGFHRARHASRAASRRLKGH